MLEALSQLDSDIFLFFNNGFRSQFFDRAMMLFTGKFIWVPMYATLLLLFARTQRWRVLHGIHSVCGRSHSLDRPDMRHPYPAYGRASATVQSLQSHG